MPLINDLLEDFESTLWYCSLDMASGFWVVKMTDRARLISVFITPFGLFEWNRMPFGLKNAPQIYQRMIDNALYGFTRIPKMAGDLENLDVFKAGEPEDPAKPSVLGRRSYIDDILVPADNCDQRCDRVEDLVSGGMPKVEYLGHKVSHDELEANPKDLSGLRKIGMEKGTNRSRIQLALASESPDPDLLTKDPTSPQPSDPSPRGPDHGLSNRDPNLASRDPTPDCVKTSNPENDKLVDLDPRWIHAHSSFKVLKEMIAKTPILRHFDPDRQAVVVVYVSDWTISGALMQEYDQIYYPVIFASRTLKSNELNYGIAENETDPSADASHHTGLVIHIQCKIQIPIPTVRSDEDLYVASFDGSPPCQARGRRLQRDPVEITWWTVVKARSGYAEGLTIDEAEYHGLLLCLDLLEGTDPLRLVICGDSNLVIRHVRGEIDCKAPGLTLLRQKALD
ncbi:reverse transcriptase [Phytophthora megakarya]|uniref:Reverse transcriptase n=1 Tax=Phytophthora megakarya TaxID=4795 RepID=A0A225W1Y3_9STRA|nr:reverse transcriptase [Phytophthora megakarya]